MIQKKWKQLIMNQTVLINPPPPPHPPNLFFHSLLKRHTHRRTKMELEDNNHLRAIKLVHLPSDTACDFPEQNCQEVQQLITNVGELLGLLKDICHQNHLKFFRSRFNSQCIPQRRGHTDFLNVVSDKQSNKNPEDFGWETTPVIRCFTRVFIVKR